MGFLEGVFEGAESGVRRGRGTGSDGAAENDQSFRISAEAGEARLNDLRGVVFGGGVEDGGWFELFVGEGVVAASQRCGEVTPCCSKIAT